MLSECSWDQAYEVASKTFSALGTEVLSLVDANGRVLSKIAYSLYDLPTFATSSMDGWVVCGQGPWKIVGEISTGNFSDRDLSESACMKIATGGVIPAGGESVLPWEDAEDQDGFIQGQSERGKNIRPAATGHDEIGVVSKPRVAIFFLGDELLHSGVPERGSIRDSLGPQLPALLEIYGANVVSAQIVKDDLNLLISNIDSVLADVDMVIATGGTADGPRDYVKPALDGLKGDLIIDRVKVRPGYHVLLAKIQSKQMHEIPFLALPGNPQSALAALISFGQPIINSLLG